MTRDRIICFRVSKEEHDIIVKLSQELNVPISWLVRESVLRQQKLLQELEKCRKELERCREACRDLTFLQEYSQLAEVEKTFRIKTLLKEVQVRVRAPRIVLTVLEVLQEELPPKEFLKIVSRLAEKNIIRVECV